MKKFTSLKLISFFIFQLSILNSCSSWFQDKVPMNMGAENATLEDLFYQKAVVDHLEPPTQIFVSQGLFPNQIVLSWSAVANAKSYRIERAVVTRDAEGKYPLPEESDFVTLVKECYSNTFNDKILSEPGPANLEYLNHYFYKISAQNNVLGLESDPSDILNNRTKGEGWLFTAPLNVEADKGKSINSVNVSWDKVDGASSYKIYRGEKENGTGMELIDSILSNRTSYSNAISNSEQGVEYYYKIVAVNSSGYESARSSIAMGYSLKEGAPATPSNVKVLNAFAESKSELKVKWDAVSPSSPTATITYSLYKTSSIDTVYTLVKGKLTSTEWTDSSNLKTGIKYYYYVQAIAFDSEKQETLKSSFSDKTDDSCGFLLSPPSSVEVLDGSSDDLVKIVWSKAVGSDVVDYSYNIYYSDTKDGNYELFKQVNELEDYDEGNCFVELAKRNFYKVSTVNPSGDESDMSMTVAPMPAAPENVVASKCMQLDSNFTPNVNNVYPVLVKWEMPKKDVPDGYYVYRSTKPDSAFRKITEEPIKTLSYIDQNEVAKSGVVYYYKVISLNSLGQGKKGNNPAEDLAQADGVSLKSVKSLGYGALTRDQWFREYNKTVMNSQKKLTLMHKPVDTDKLGKETVSGYISGTLSYDAHLKGLGAEIVMPYKDYADYAITKDSSLVTTTVDTLSIYFRLNGNNDTTSNMSANGNMSGTVKCEGMYPGDVNYGTLEIKGGGAGGGYYGVTLYDLDKNELNVITNQDRNKQKASTKEVHWLVGEEGR